MLLIHQLWSLQMKIKLIFVELERFTGTTTVQALQGYIRISLAQLISMGDHLTELGFGGIHLRDLGTFYIQNKKARFKKYLHI